MSTWEWNPSGVMRAAGRTSIFFPCINPLVRFQFMPRGIAAMFFSTICPPPNCLRLLLSFVSALTANRHGTYDHKSIVPKLNADTALFLRVFVPSCLVFFKVSVPSCLG